MSDVMIDFDDRCCHVSIYTNRHLVCRQKATGILRISLFNASASLVLCVNYWYQTAPVKATYGMCFKLVRRYAAWVVWLLCALVLGAIYLKYATLMQGICLLLFIVVLDKYVAYELRETTVSVVMT